MQVCIVVISDTSGYSTQSHMSPHVWRKSSLPSTPKSKPRKDEIAMSKLADMAMAIQELHDAATAIDDVAN